MFNTLKGDFIKPSDLVERFRDFCIKEKAVRECWLLHCSFLIKQLWSLDKGAMTPKSFANFVRLTEHFLFQNKHVWKTFLCQNRRMLWSSPNNSSDVQRRRDQGQGSLSLTMTMSPAWGSAGDRTATGQPGHRSAIGVWSPVNSASMSSLSLSDSFSHFTESLLTHKSPPHSHFIFIAYSSHHGYFMTLLSFRGFLWKKIQPIFLLN